LYENGYGKIVGRIKDIIIRGGENIFPKEIEDFLNSHDNIAEAHVVSFGKFKSVKRFLTFFFQIGIPDDRMGEEVGAFIKLKDQRKTLAQTDIKTFCKDKLAHFKIPKFVVTIDEFPRTPSGKIQKYKFLEVFADKLESAK
jgi:acyl-CoA synthetase (AMP-forming)/AMP-acid ligase II